MGLNNKSESKLAVILGSGLDVIAENIADKKLISSDTSGIHRKRIYTAAINGTLVIIFCGRKHHYEGFSKEQVLENIRIAEEFGVKRIIITNAAGGLNPNFRESDLMLITSHINFNPKLSLPGGKISYSPDFYGLFKRVCSELKIRLFDGVYGCLPGPAFETPSEIRMLRKIGADAVGMSTIPEVIAASYHGLSILAVSVITNILKESDMKPLSHNHVLEVSRIASTPLRRAIFKLVSELN